MIFIMIFIIVVLSFMNEARVIFDETQIELYAENIA